MTIGQAQPAGALPPPASAQATAGPSTAQRAARGGMWTMAGYGGSQVVRFATNLVMTRVLFDADAAYGLVALAWSVIQGLRGTHLKGRRPTIRRERY